MRKKQKGGCDVYILGMYAVLLIVLVALYTLHVRTINFVRDEFDSGLLLALLGAATVNVEEYGRSGQTVIHSTYVGEEEILEAAENALCPDEYLDNALSKCKELLAANLKLDADRRSNQAVVTGPVVLEEFKIYNVYKNTLGEFRIYEFIWRDTGWSVLTHAVNEKVYAAGAGDRGEAEAPVENTTVYAKISFSVVTFPYFPDLTEEVPEPVKTIKAVMQRSVSVPQNQ